MHIFNSLIIFSTLFLVALGFSVDQFCETKPKDKLTLSCHPEEPNKKIYCPSGAIYTCRAPPLFVKPATKEICQLNGNADAPRCVPDIGMNPKEWCKKHEFPGSYCHEAISTIRIVCPEGWIFKCPQENEDYTNVDAEQYGFMLNKCSQKLSSLAVCEMDGDPSSCETPATKTQSVFVTVTPQP